MCTFGDTHVCVILHRPTGGYAGRAGQLQHHSEGAEAAVQHAARRGRLLGE